MITESIALTGKVNIIHLDQFGDKKDERTINNLVVTTGKTFIASRMSSNTTTVMSRMGVGTSTSAAVAGDTSLVSAIVAGNVAIDSSVASSNTVTYVATFPAGTGTGAITEAGIFNGFPGVGTMLCRTVFSAVNKAIGDVIVITWVVSVS